MATYINYGEGEEDAIVQGAEWLQKVIAQQSGPEAEKAFKEQFHALQEAQTNNKKYDCGPVFDFLVESSKGLFAAIPENRPEDRVKEIESFFALILSMLLLLEDAEHLDKATTNLCDFFSNSTEQQPELRLRLLMMLYNTFNNPSFEFRYRVFKHVLDYAAQAELFDQVLPYLEYLESWMADWETYMKMEDKRQLYYDIQTNMRKMGKKVEAFQYLKTYHSLFKGEKDSALNKQEIADATIQLIKDAVHLPNVIQFDDIIALDTVQALKKTKEDSLVKLCEVFLSGSVNDLKEFQKKNQKVFDAHGLNFQDALSKIRLLTLATMSHGKSEMSLDEIAKALEESPDNVEPWVVRSISEGVIDGRIDQLNRKVLVKSSFQRKFENEQWDFLDSKLTQWIDNLEHVIKFVGEQNKA
eukprot:TRINITY_DN96860_c0_g1_i1.p1 TRINITY_DN96860_c0_g1~~TRINITY_DN96860_c0_g1_i1.p1  ORF type:complete len:433 (-),score=133.39 TRINITY_DN96860_c0_g1_i1:257-1495(-)